MRIQINSSIFFLFSEERQSGDLGPSDKSLISLHLPGTQGQIRNPAKHQDSLHFKMITWKTNELLRSHHL